jgi:hypothetical protein
MRDKHRLRHDRVRAGRHTNTNSYSHGDSNAKALSNTEIASNLAASPDATVRGKQTIGY